MGPDHGTIREDRGGDSAGAVREDTARIDHAAPELPVPLPAPPRLNGANSGAQPPLPTVLAMNPDSVPAPNWAGDRADISSALERLQQALGNRSLAQLDAASAGNAAIHSRQPAESVPGRQCSLHGSTDAHESPLGRWQSGDRRLRAGRQDDRRRRRPTGPGHACPDHFERVSGKWVIQSIQDLR